MKPSDLLRLIRPLQWTKNLALFAGLVFAHRLTDPSAVFLSMRAFATFCLISSAIYVLNDIVDRNRDRLSPRKSSRPIASGRVTIPVAAVICLLLAVGAALLSWPLAPRFRVAVGTYGALMVAYSLYLKNIAILDVLIIVVGFVLRVQAGVDVLAAPHSAWILLCTFALASLLGFGKRRSELEMEPGGSGHRPSLAQYTTEYLDHGITLSATLTLVTYALYAVLGPQPPSFLLTFLPVFYGVARFHLLVTKGRGTEAPERVLVGDAPLASAVLIWVILCVLILYGNWEILPSGPVLVPSPR